MLELDSVSKLYPTPGETIHAVDGVSLAVEPGELVAIHGPSGSGKTTLLLLAAGLVDPDGGAVRFRGVGLDSLSEPEASEFRLTQLGFIFQTFNLLPGLTAVDNVAIPLMLAGQPVGRARTRALETVRLVGLEERAGHLPASLSGGERQRVAIARALVAGPRLILADEPTGNLDTHRGNQLLSILSGLCRERGVGVILVTHDIHAATYADRIQLLRDGKLEDHGEDRSARALGPMEPSADRGPAG